MGLFDDLSDDLTISPEARKHRESVRKGIKEALSGESGVLDDTLDELAYGKDYDQTKRATRAGVKTGLEGEGLLI